MTTGSVWNPDSIKDVAESVGIASLSTDVVDHLTRDVEFRISQILEEALKFMRHAKRTTLHTQDVSQALRALDVEPLYGYESTRPLRFGEASLGPGQPLYYLDDEEVDFEKLINAPLPKVPREITFTAHWLAVEGVQPSIPMNPAPADAARNDSLLPKGAGAAAAHLAAAAAGADNVSVRPLVKHVLSRELQLYFEHVCAALLDEGNAEYRAAALASLGGDPGIHQLLPYFVQFVAEKVTHGLRSLFVLTQMMHLVAALLDNANLAVDPYVASLVPPVLTCLVGKRLGAAADAAGPTVSTGSPAAPPPHYHLRALAASLLQLLCRKRYTASMPQLKPRLARALLKHLLAPVPQPLGTYYGALLGLCDIAGADGVRTLVLPNLKALGEVLAEAPAGPELDELLGAIMKGLTKLEAEAPRFGSGGFGADGTVSAEMLGELEERVGGLVAARISELGSMRLARAVLEPDFDL